MILYKRCLNKSYIFALGFFIIALFLVLSWFHDGHFFGGGDTGLPIYNPQRVFEMSKSIWWDNIAPGFLVPQSITSVIFYLVLALLQYAGLDALKIQELLFFSVLFCMGYGMYLLILSLIGRDKKTYAFVGGFFYIFNPFTMVQVWHRFDYTSFIFIAALPFLVLFWNLWLNKGKYIYLIYFSLVNLLASYMFGTLAYVISLWLVISILSISGIFLPWQGLQHSIRLFFRSTFGLLIWLLIDSWWLLPIFTIGSDITSQQHTIGESILTLLVISKQAIIPYTIQMINSYYVFDKAELGEVYRSLLFRIIPWINTIIISVGIVVSLRKKNLAIYVLLFLVTIMLAKGVSSPFGQPFLLLFSRFFAVGVLRDPFEKIGILLPFVGSILFSVGIEAFFFNYRKKIKNFLLIFFTITIFLLLAIYYLPMYKGSLFGLNGNLNFVEVPQSYIDANKWIESEVRGSSLSDGKILHLPLIRNDIVTYKWTYGYHGIESSASLFTALPSISHTLNIPIVDNSLSALSSVFNDPNNVNRDKILELLQDFNVRFIVLHEDSVWQGGDLNNPSETEKVLNSLDFIRLKARFGSLVVYEVEPKFFSPKVIFADNVKNVAPLGADTQLWPWINDTKDSQVITLVGNTDEGKIGNNIKEIDILPEKVFSYLAVSDNGVTELIQNLSGFLTRFNYLKNLADKNGDQSSAQEIETLIACDEDLINITQSNNKNYVFEKNSLGDDYLKKISNLFENKTQNSNFVLYADDSIFNDFFKLQLSLLKKLNIDALTKAKKEIEEYLYNQGEWPTYDYKNSKGFSTQGRVINRFGINQSGAYELLMTGTHINDLYSAGISNLDLQVDNQLVRGVGVKKDNLVSFGELYFSKGKHEVSINQISSENLIHPSTDVSKSGNASCNIQGKCTIFSEFDSPSYIEFNLGPVSGGEIYQTKFNVQFINGVAFYVQIIQDNDQILNGTVNPRINETIYLPGGESGDEDVSLKLGPLGLSTKNARLRILVDSQRNIPATGYLPKTSLEIKDLQVNRIFTNEFYMRKQETQTNSGDRQNQVFSLRKISPYLYEGKVSVNDPSFILFKETYDPGWSLTLWNKNGFINPKVHAIADFYGNAWWVNKSGQYDFKIQFKPQDQVINGVKLSVLGMLILLSMIVFQKITNR